MTGMLVNTFAAKSFKYGLFLFSFGSLVSGIVAVYLGAWIIIERTIFEAVVGTNLYTSAASIMIASGLMTLLTSLTNCVAALRETKLLLVVAFAASILLFLTMLIVAVLGFVFKDHRALIIVLMMIGSLERAMTVSLKDQYGIASVPDIRSEAVTNAWDYIQKTFVCCAVGNASDTNYNQWVKSRWYDSNKLFPRERVPESCCSTCAQLLHASVCDSTNVIDVERSACEYCKSAQLTNFVNLELCQGTSENALMQWPRTTYMNSEGCHPAVLSELSSISLILTAVGLSIMSILTICLVLALCLLRYVL